MNDKENAAIGANSNFGLSNSMMSSGAPSTGTGGGSSFGNAKYDSLYKMVSGCDREEGMSREELASTLGGKNILMIYIPYSRHYNPRFVHCILQTHFLKANFGYLRVFLSSPSTTRLHGGRAEALRTEISGRRPR